ncbi:MAG: hypothetical protein IJ193_00195 [Bacilli bacterium]|nr:hypothetical protein [Bacilli bacterium]
MNDHKNIMSKQKFLDIVKGYNREEFREYLYRDINKKRKLLVIAIKVDDEDKDHYLSLLNS